MNPDFKPCNSFRMCSVCMALHGRIPRSQKARGVVALAHAYEDKVPTFTLIASADDPNFTALPYPIFARPCPMRPRHGFVDSRVVDTPDEARAVFASALAADPEAEMMLARPVDRALASAILTPGTAAIGPSNDGATSGHGSISISLAALTTKVSDHVAGIAEGEMPYVEVVYDHKGTPLLTQVRSGPKVAGGQADRIPVDVTVSQVMKAEGDLLEWEAKMRLAPQGTAIYHPGGTQVSHYAAHAGKNGVPVFTTREPIVGEVLKSNVGDVPPYDVPAFRAGVGAGWSTKLSADKAAAPIHILLLAAHHALATPTPLSAWALGYGAAMMVRLGMAASLGEARHARGRRTRKRTKQSRAAVYVETMDHPMESLNKATKTYRLFQEGEWGSAFGGKAWGACLNAAIDLETALRLAYKRGGQSDIKELIGALHTAINQAHNNGWWLNKFVSGDTFDRHARADVRAVARAVFHLWAAWSAENGLPVNMRLMDQWTKRRKPRMERRPRFQVSLENGDTARIKVQIGLPGKFLSYMITKTGDQALDISARPVVKSLMPGSSAKYAKLDKRRIPAWVIEAVKAQGWKGFPRRERATA